jgi:putative exosortase-associated protein (TIGR04073 family)
VIFPKKLQILPLPSPAPHQYPLESMKKLLISFAALSALTLVVSADIQAPPGSTYTAERKLGRALSNIVYGIAEIPEQIVRKNNQYGSKAGTTYGLVDGSSRALRRVGYGFYELFTFTCPTYRGTFKPPYERCGADNRIEMNPHDGLSEFPPQLGFESYYDHARSQKY